MPPIPWKAPEKVEEEDLEAIEALERLPPPELMAPPPGEFNGAPGAEGAPRGERTEGRRRGGADALPRGERSPRAEGGARRPPRGGAAAGGAD
jgi:hypothetical protein